MIESVKSKHGCTIKVCCASCFHSSIMNDELRKCGLTNEYKHPSDKCIAWEVKPKLMKNAGKGGGLIRSKEKIIEAQEKKIAEGKLKISYTQIKMNDVLSKKGKEEAVVCEGNTEEAKG